MDNNELRLLYDVMERYYHCTFMNVKTRKRDIVEKKQMFAFVAHRYGATFQQIADLLGLKNPSTIIHAYRTMSGYMEIYPEFRKQYYEILDEYAFQEAAGLLAQKDR